MGPTLAFSHGSQPKLFGNLNICIKPHSILFYTIDFTRHTIRLGQIQLILRKQA